MELDVTGLAGYDDVSVRFTHGNLSLIPNFDEEAYFSRSWFVDTEVMGCSRVSLWPATLLDLGTESGDPGSWYFDGVSVSVAAAFVNATNSLQVTFDARCRSNIFTTVRHVLDGAAGATPGLAAFAVAGACGLLSMVPGLGRGAGRQCFNLSWMSVLLMALMAVFVVSQSTLGKLCSCNSAEIEIVFYHDPSVLVNGATAGATVVSGDSLLLECTNDQGSSVPCYFQPNSSQCFFSDRSIYGNCGSGRPFGTNDGSVVEAEVSWREALLHYSTGTVLADDNAALDWAPDFPGMLLDWSDACMSMQTDMSDATSGQLTPLIPRDLTSTFSVGRWLEQGQAEHASVAAFNRASLSLMAVGAPARIIRDTQIAAVEEVRHAELSFSLAALCNHATNASSTNDDVTGSLLRREKHGLSVQVPEVHDMAIPQPLEFDTDVIDVLRSTFHEGCIAEVSPIRVRGSMVCVRMCGSMMLLCLCSLGLRRWQPWSWRICANGLHRMTVAVCLLRTRTPCQDTLPLPNALWLTLRVRLWQWLCQRRLGMPFSRGVRFDGC